MALGESGAFFVPDGFPWLGTPGGTSVRKWGLGRIVGWGEKNRTGGVRGNWGWGLLYIVCKLV